MRWFLSLSPMTPLFYVKKWGWIHYCWKRFDCCVLFVKQQTKLMSSCYQQSNKILNCPDTIRNLYPHPYWTCIHLLSDPTCTGSHSPVCSKNPEILDNIKWKNNISWANHYCGPIDNQSLCCAPFLGRHCTMVTCIGAMALSQFLTTTIHKKYSVPAILLLWMEMLEWTAKYNWSSQVDCLWMTHKTIGYSCCFVNNR
jgi:hypothetical protein